jgi:hypothetical protein
MAQPQSREITLHFSGVFLLSIWKQKSNFNLTLLDYIHACHMHLEIRRKMHEDGAVIFIMNNYN